MSFIDKYIPLIADLKKYSIGLLNKDISAGITVGVMLVPQGMAYAYLSGMPPIYGLYAGLLPLIFYSIFGTSRHLSVGPVAVSALLVYAGIKDMADPLSGQFVQLAILAAFMIGVFQILISALRLGLLVNFISHPVISGFTSAAAIVVAVSQLKDILGMEVPRFSNPLSTVWHIGENLLDFNGYTLSLSALALASLILFKRWNNKIPAALIIVVISTLLSWLFDFKALGIKVVGIVPDGLPEFNIPKYSFENVRALLPTVLTVTAISIVESLGIAKAYEGKSKKYKIKNNQELFALGIANIFGSFTQSMPTSGSFSRSAVNYGSKAQTGLASIFAALIVLLSLLFLTPLFKHLPIAVLASIILLAIKNLFDIEEAIRLWKVHKRDFTMLIVTFLGTLILGIEVGVLLGFSLSIVTVLYRSSRPNIVELGKLPNSNYFRSTSRYNHLEPIENHIIIRFDDQLYFGNSVYFKDCVIEKIEAKKDKVAYLVLDASNMHDIDSTGLSVLNDVYQYTLEIGIELKIANMVGQVEDMIENAGIFNQKNSPVKTYGSVKEAVEKS
ncbi:MAG: SulP family inorganic anion transporter [Bacteroidia bacterium]